MAINSKNIVKNSLFLYTRMLLVMLCNFFVIRIVLKALGAEDFGINNVVGGVVMMLAFVASTINAASQRFFAFELGKNNLDKLKKYFTITFDTYVGFAIVAIIIAETFGVYFLEHKMTIPMERASAAFWVYQGSVISFVLGLIAIPYNAIVIAREKMNVYAYVGIFEVLMRLLAACSLYVISGDRLKGYAVFLCVATSLPSVFYIIWGTYCFSECRIMKFWDRNMFKEIVSFSSWNLFGAISAVLRSQGINILLNLFFNPVVNAARAIAYQLNSAATQFILNFFKAVQPQIVKSYAAGEKSSLFTLVYASTKYSFFLVILISLPLLLETPTFLSIWLSNYPEYTVLFTRIVVIIAIFESLIYPLQTALMATGNIKKYQIVTGGLLLLVLPISYIFLKFGYPPETVLYVTLVDSVVSQISRIVFMKKMLFMPLKDYFFKSILPVIAVSILGAVFPIMIKLFFFEGVFKFIFVCICSPISVLLCSYYVGMNKFERDKLKMLVIRKIKKQPMY